MMGGGIFRYSARKKWWAIGWVNLLLLAPSGGIYLGRNEQVRSGEGRYMAVKAVAKNIGMSPKKMRRILSTDRGKKVEVALEILRFLPSPAAKAVAKVVKSAANNAENNNMMAQGDLKIVAIKADHGVTMRRFRARARGRASRILKKSSHVTVLLDEEEQS